MLDFDKQIKTVELDIEIRETVWIGDTAMDRDRLDPKKWYDEGDFALTKLEKPALIRWRGLYPREVRRVFSSIGVLTRADAEAYTPDREDNLREECLRYGLVSIEGLRLERHNGRLADSTINSLSTLTEDVDELGGSIWLTWWLGGLIAARSFRGRK